MSNTIEDYCDQIESNVDEIYRNSEEYSDEIIALADEFRDAASEIRDDAEAANEKYHELRDRYDEQNEEIQKCYQALEKMATVEEQHKKTRRWILGAAGAVITAGGIDTVLTHGNDGVSMTEASITDVDGIGSYLESLTRRERDEWSTLWNVYNPETNEFFSEQDNINLNGIDIRHRDDPDLDSDYRLESEIEGNEDLSDWQTFEHDETARDALEHFGEL